MYIYIYIHKYIHTLHYLTLPYRTLPDLTLHYITYIAEAPTTPLVWRANDPECKALARQDLCISGVPQPT